MLILKPLTCLNTAATIKLLLSSSFNSIRPTNHLRYCNNLNLSTTTRSISTNEKTQTDKDNDTVSITFLKPDGKKVVVKGCENKSLYDVVIDNNVDIDGFGACEGTLCCTTCHLIFKQSDYEKVGDPSDEELDMLDLAYGLTDTSRLGCQVILKKELDPLEVEVPASINDVREC